MTAERTGRLARALGITASLLRVPYAAEYVCLRKWGPRVRGGAMCRNIRTLYNFEPPATEDEIRASSLQFVRKLSGFSRPSKANQVVFDRAVERVTHAARELLDALVTSAPRRDRELEASKARARSAERFHTSRVGSAGAQA